MEALGCSLEALAGSLESPGNLWGALGSSLGLVRAPWERLGALRGSLGAFGSSLNLLKCSLGAPGRSWKALGCSLEALGGSLEAPGSSLGTRGCSMGPEHEKQAKVASGKTSKFVTYKSWSMFSKNTNMRDTDWHWRSLSGPGGAICHFSNHIFLGPRGHPEAAPHKLPAPKAPRALIPLPDAAVNGKGCSQPSTVYRWVSLGDLGSSWGALGLGRSWDALGSSWGALAASWVLLGRP